VPLAKHGMKAPRFSLAELKVRAIASRRANQQLSRVPWRRFRRAYEEYPRWQAFALWSRAVIATEGHAPSGLVKTLRARCLGFVEDEASSQEPGLLAFHLLEWIHNRRFGYAKRQGWLDALAFYGVRHPVSRGAWAYWEHCENEWEAKRPTSLPTFDKWWRAALQWELCDNTSCLAVARAVQRYLDWEALSLWLRPLFDTSLTLPRRVLSERERRCPGVSKLDRSAACESRQARSTVWLRVVKRGKDHCLSQATEEGWLDLLLEQVHSHPWHVRMRAYAAHWSKESSRSRALPYPSFHQWEQAAANYVKADPDLMRQKSFTR
jgi:hypothetical protein